MRWACSAVFVYAALGYENLVNISRFIVREFHAGALVGHSLADELLPHVLNTWCVRHAAHPANGVRSGFIAQRHADLFEWKKPARKHLQHDFNPIRGDRHRINERNPELEKKDQARQNE